MAQNTPVNLDDPRFDILNGGHAAFSPSASAMWLWCAGSLIPNLLAEDDGSEEAAEGTVAHEMAEYWLKLGARPTHFVGRNILVDKWDIPVTNAMLDYVEEYVEWCNDLPGDHHVETKVYFDRVTPIPRQGGTADHAACATRVLTLTDLKFGKGIKVFAAEDLGDPRALIHNTHTGEVEKINGNPQLMLYALGFYNEWDWLYGFKKVVLRICQPRLGHFQTWETTVSELLIFAEWVKVRAALAWTPDAPRRASEKGCQWCKVRATCAELARFYEDVHGSVFGDVTTPGMTVQDIKAEIDHGDYRVKLLPLYELSTAQMEALLPWRKLLEGWFNDLAEELERRAKAGEAMTAYKLVDGRSTRSWRNPRKAERALIEAGIDTLLQYKLSFVSPAQAEDLLVEAGMRRKDAAKLLETLAEKGRGKATLAPLSDARPRADAVADDVFVDTTL
jgi:hypothetical protein